MAPPWHLALLFALALANPLPLDQVHQPKCGYQSCPATKPGHLNIHLVAHTHDDVGWLKTYDQYYYGNNNTIQDAGVQYILDSVVQELLHDPHKRFIYVETAYFWKWWKEQDDTTRHQVKKLVSNGQLEFIGGGWSMHDEAATHYHSIIDQMTWGFRRLNDTFGACARPKIGWQIDPFGHSRESASLMARMGFDGLFLGRIDYQDKGVRMDAKTAEMIWSTSDNDESDATKLFTGILYNTYSAPKGFCFDINCHDEPIVDNKKSPEYNAPKRVHEFLELMKNYKHSYRTDNILVTMGDDFMYMDAHVYYKNMDKLIKHINGMGAKDTKVHAFYSTPSCYLKAVHDAGISFPTKSDDFMPYSSDPYSFWSGYFTSRPAIKYFERLGNNFLQVCKQLYSLGQLGPEDNGDLNAMREAMGVMQHHDAVTGTEKQHVAADYARILTHGFKECSLVVKDAFNKLASKSQDSPPPSISSCLLLNISSCPLSESNQPFFVTVYNPLSRNLSHMVQLPVSDEKLGYSVKDSEGKDVVSQVIGIPKQLHTLPGRKSSAKAQLFFKAESIPPLGFRTFYISPTGQMSLTTKQIHLNPHTQNTFGYSSGVTLTLDKNGHLKSVNLKGEPCPMSQDFHYYRGYVGNNEVFLNRSSGAYIFRPDGDAIPINNSFESKVFRGPLVTEVHQKFSDWVSQVVRIYKGEPYVEFQWMVGPIPIDDGHGKEVVTRFRVERLHNNGVFYTDSNGREMIERRLNYRPTWKVKLAEEVPGNYYPVTTMVAIQDNGKRMSVITDRAQGASSLRDGEIEIMMHRRLLHDDAFGVGESLNETAFGKGLVVRGSHFVTLGDKVEARFLMQEKVLKPWTFISPANGMTFDQWKDQYKMKYSGLKKDLPRNVQILTLEPWIGRSYLLRLENILEKSDYPQAATTVHLDDIFNGWLIHGVEEMMLGGNERVADSKRLKWKVDGEDHSKRSRSQPHAHSLPTIDLAPMEIRTFIIHVTPI